jgi:hypothetical protein
MVILAQDTSGRSPARSSQKTTTVMLVSVPNLGRFTTVNCDRGAVKDFGEGR